MKNRQGNLPASYKLPHGQRVGSESPSLVGQVEGFRLRPMRAAPDKALDVFQRRGLLSYLHPRRLNMPTGMPSTCGLSVGGFGTLTEVEMQ